MRHWIGLLIALSLVTGCGSSPSEAYTDMTTAAQMGDRDGFLNGFTERSRDLVGSLIGLSEAYGLLDSNPYELLVFDSIDDEQIEASGERAILEVRRRGSTRKLLMIREDGAWRIDTAELETFWESEGR
jgi:hypothetical protein